MSLFTPEPYPMVNQLMIFHLFSSLHRLCHWNPFLDPNILLIYRICSGPVVTKGTQPPIQYVFKPYIPPDLNQPPIRTLNKPVLSSMALLNEIIDQDGKNYHMSCFFAGENPVESEYLLIYQENITLLASTELHKPCIPLSIKAALKDDL